MTIIIPINKKDISISLHGFDLFLSFHYQTWKVSKSGRHEKNDGEALGCDCRCYDIERKKNNINNIIIYKSKTITLNMLYENSLNKN